MSGCGAPALTITLIPTRARSPARMILPALDSSSFAAGVRTARSNAAPPAMRFVSAPTVSLSTLMVCPLPFWNSSATASRTGFIAPAVKTFTSSARAVASDTPKHARSRMIRRRAIPVPIRSPTASMATGRNDRIEGFYQQLRRGDVGAVAGLELIAAPSAVGLRVLGKLTKWALIGVMHALDVGSRNRHSTLQSERLFETFQRLRQTVPGNPR